MAKAKEAQKGELVILSSGVEVTVLAVPPGLLTRIQKDYPDEVPPKKTIKVLDGTEEVDNPKDPEYKKKQAAVELARNTKMGEVIVEFCLQCDLSKYEGVIKRLEKYVSPYPDDPDERRIRFLYEHALKTTSDYSITQAVAIEQITVTDKEVQERIESFPANLSRSQANGAKASSSDEALPLEVERSQT